MGAPPAVPTHWGGRGSPRRGWLQRARPRSSSTAKHPLCDWDWPNELAVHLGAPAVRLAQLRADDLTQIVKTQAGRTAA